MIDKKKWLQLSKLKQMMCIYMLFLGLLALSVLLMPVASAVRENTRVLMVFSGLFFWTGLVGTVYMAWKINQYRKNDKRFKKTSFAIKQLGIFRFFQNADAKKMDITMFVSLAGFLIMQMLTEQLFISFIFLALFIFAFGMHCMLNGMNYKYMNEKENKYGI